MVCMSLVIPGAKARFYPPHPVTQSIVVKECADIPGLRQISACGRGCAGSDPATDRAPEAKARVPAQPAVPDPWLGLPASATGRGKPGYRCDAVSANPLPAPLEGSIRASAAHPGDPAGG